MTTRPQITITAINIDRADAEAMARFYGALLGWAVTWRDSDFILMENPAGGVGISFQEERWYRPPVWPERDGDLTKMMHLDIRTDDLEAAAAYAIECGARPAEHQPRPDLRIMLDPAGTRSASGRIDRTGRID